MITAAQTFKAFLARVPDGGPAITKADIQEISVIVEEVIEHIEARLDRHCDSHETQLELASLIYRIRARMEELTRWGRHLAS